MYKIPLRAYSGDPQAKFSWQSFDAKSSPYFGAVAYYFAEKLQKSLGVTIGIVNCSYGGTNIEAWMSLEELEKSASKKYLDDDAKKMAKWKNFEDYDRVWQQFQEDRKVWDLRKKQDASFSDPAPVEPYGFRTKGRPSTLRDSMLNPVLPYTARGALWYQGENNAGRPADYAKALPVFMEGLRKSKNEPNWPI
jgi:sialate O-acetylesterase